MSFSPDGKLLVALGGAPEWNVVLWQWEKSKASSVVPSRVANQAPGSAYQCEFSPFVNADGGYTATVCGQNLFRAFKINDGVMKPLASALGKREMGSTFTAHGWLPTDEPGRERCVVANEEGDVLVVENNEVVAAIPATEKYEGCAIHCIVPFGVKGFVAGGEDGALLVYEKQTDEREPFKLTKSFTIESDGKNASIRNLAIDANEENLIATMDDNQAWTLSLANIDVMKPEEMNFERMSAGFHSNGVTGVDLCVRKPLVVTCSTDKSVRVWNYVERTAELVKHFAEEAHSVAFHPSGLQILVGFSDKLQLMNLLMDDIRPYKEFSIKACPEVVFNNAGNCFAAVNGNVIQVYNMYTCENVGNLRGHSGKVRTVCWSPDDTKITTAGLDGAVYEWELKDFKRVHENVDKECSYSCLAPSPDGTFTYGVGSDRMLKEFDAAYALTQEFSCDAGALTQVAIPASGRSLFAATERGTVRAYKYPLDGEFQEYQCHAASITRMRLTFDDSLLFCVSEDACLYVFDVQTGEKEKAGKGAAKSKEALVTYAEEVLVTKMDINEKNGRMQELQMQVTELQLQSEYQLRMKDMNMNEKIKDLTDRFTLELEQAQTKFELLLQEKNEQEMEYEERLRQTDEKNAKETRQLENQFQEQILVEVERYQNLQRDKDLLNEQWDEQNSLLVESHERVIEELTAEFSEKLQDEQMHAERMRADRDLGAKESEETRKQLEEDADQEIDDLKNTFETKLKQEREVGLRLKGENGILKKKFTAFQKEVNDAKAEVQSLFKDKQNLYNTIAGLEKDIEGLKKEIRERDETIGDKEKRIYDLKKKNQELEKFKFVLDYKIKELKKQIEPREQDIADMKNQILEMDHELERYHKNNTHLDLTISDLRGKLAGLQKDVLNQRKTIQDRDGKIHQFQKDLHETVRVIQSPKALAESVKGLFQRHTKERDDVENVDDDIQKEYQRQREYLERTIESLKHKLHKDMESHKSDNMRIMQENVSLIKEINELRREIKQERQAKKNAAAADASRRSASRASTANGGSRGSARGAFGAAGKGAGAFDVDEMLAREIEAQRAEIQNLRVDAERKDALLRAANAALEAEKARAEAERAAAAVDDSPRRAARRSLKEPPTQKADEEEEAATATEAAEEDAAGAPEPEPEPEPEPASEPLDEGELDPDAPVEPVEDFDDDDSLGGAAPLEP